MSLLADTSNFCSVASLPKLSGSEYSWLVDRSSLLCVCVSVCVRRLVPSHWSHRTQPTQPTCACVCVCLCKRAQALTW